MKYLIVLAFFLLSPFLLKSQEGVVDLAEHKVIFQLTTADTNVHKMLLKQFGNLLTAAPNTHIEVVCHGPGISMMQSALSIVHPKITEMKAKGVNFVVCENALRERKVSKEEIVPEANFVKAGILEVIQKQEQGWTYIRATQ